MPTPQFSKIGNRKTFLLKLPIAYLAAYFLAELLILITALRLFNRLIGRTGDIFGDDLCRTAFFAGGRIGRVESVALRALPQDVANRGRTEFIC